jgi:hypothetical protein
MKLLCDRGDLRVESFLASARNERGALAKDLRGFTQFEAAADRARART